MRMFFIIVCSILAGSICVQAQDDATTEEHLDQVFSQAQAAQQQGDYRTAARCYEEIVKLRPDVAEAWANLGVMYQFQQEYDKADRDFRVALAKNPHLYSPNLFLGLNQLRVQQPGAALRYLQAAENINPKDEQAAMGLARTYQVLHNDIAAGKWFSHAAEINPSDPEAWYGMGMFYLSLQDAAVVQLAKLGQNEPYARSLVADAFVAQGRVPEAIAIYNKLLASSPQPPCLLSALGFAYVQHGSEDLAQKAFENELEKNPGCLAARLGMARLAVGKGDFAAAFDAAHVAWESDQNFVRANVQRIWKGVSAEQLGKAATWLQQGPSSQDKLAEFLAQSISGGEPAANAVEESKGQTSPASSSPESYETLWSLGHYTACEAKLQKAKTPASVEGALFLAQCSFYSGDYRTSLTATSAALEKNPQSPAALYWKAKSCQELASNALEQMSVVAPGSAKVHLLLAELHRAREEFGAAEAEYNQVLNSASNDPTAHLGLAQIYYQQSKDDKALEQADLVLRNDPGNPLGNFLKGEILVRGHQYADAMPYLKKALAGPPLSLPQIHALLARCLAAQGDYSTALAELKPALPSDTTGIFHYQLYQIYKKLGDEKAASAAFQESERLRREEAAAEVKQKATAVPPAAP